MKHWLIKSEPDVYPLSQLKKDGRTLWTGVRNYQARNFMIKEMTVGDLVLFYHSNAEPAGVVGLAKVSAAAQPDPTQFDRKSEYFDEKSTKDNPRWQCVEVAFVEAFAHLISLADIKKDSQLQKMVVAQRGSRLSIQPVETAHFERICRLGRANKK